MLHALHCKFNGLVIIGSLVFIQRKSLIVHHFEHLVGRLGKVDPFVGENVLVGETDIRVPAVSEIRTKRELTIN